MLRNHHNNQKGFSLLEVVMAMGAFTLIMMGTIQIMAQGSKNYRSTKLIQTNLETAQFALNAMAKELRTSSVVTSSTGAIASSVTFFDYSQSRCIQYRADESTGTVTKRSHAFGSADPDANRTSCAGYTFTEAPEEVLSGLSNQAFNIDMSTGVLGLSSPHVGRVTVALTVGAAGGAATVQTTVSLRDFNYVGI
jgi:prepilin-type N-terminal cleavage/methylation domain-containing protein